MNRILLLLAGVLLLAALPPSARALDLTEMFKSKPPLTGDERKETVDKIKEIQEKLQLLQDKLRALEKRKAMEAAAQTGGSAPEPVAGEANWQAIEQTTVKPGDFGLYTYLLFAGSETDDLALGSLGDLILTIETLPASTEPAVIGNRFLVPVEAQQSLVVLARRPYDFKLSRTYLDRLGLGGLPDGPVLVSLLEPLDPFGMELVQPFLAVALGHQEPRRSMALIKIWHGYERAPLPASGHPLADLFWQVLDGNGPTRVTRAGGRVLIDIAPPSRPGSPGKQAY